MAPLAWRTFAQGPVGLIVLGVLGVLALTGTLFELGPYIAILVLLIFGLLLPITFGQRRISRLAILGVVMLLVTAPVFTVLDVNQLRLPSPPASSDPSSPYGHGGSVIGDAIVTPFTGASGGSYNFSATIDPAYLPLNTSIVSLTFYVTDCPGATSNTSSSCPGPYPLYKHTVNFTSPPTSKFPASYLLALKGTDVWWWNLEVVAESDRHPANSTGNLTGIWLFVNGAYEGVEGPVTGSFLAVAGLLLPYAYELLFIYPGIVFLIALLVYAFLKRREAVRKGFGVPGPTAPGAPPSPSASPPGDGAGGAPAVEERRCPSCQAVVYPNEASCWKCGASLAAPKTADAAPLRTSGSAKP